MYHPTTRLLTVLELLQTHGQMSGTELGKRLEVDARTIRRYVMMLQEIGIPVEADMGRYGGYMLRAGFKLPPMMFTNDEAFALILGLLIARQMGFAPGVEGTLAKLYRVLPETLRHTVQAVEQTLTLDLRPQHGIREPLLVLLSQSIHAGRQVQITYQKGDENSQRAVNPYGLVVHDGAGYLIGYCHLRQGIRVFRLDRISDAQSLPGTFSPPADFDSLRYLLDSFANMPDRWQVEVILATTLEQAEKVIPPGMGILTPDPAGVKLRTGSQDIDFIARYLVGTGIPLTICQPPELRQAYERLAASILETARR
jgi:predicted DNA-binding transcriptional regulator YafY